jgi:hypothetical protein
MRSDWISSSAKRTGCCKWSLDRRANDAMDEERFRFLKLALDRVHQAVERQRHRALEPPK